MNSTLVENLLAYPIKGTHMHLCVRELRPKCPRNKEVIELLMLHTNEIKSVHQEILRKDPDYVVR